VNSLILVICSNPILYIGKIKEKAIIADGLSSLAPPGVLFSNHFFEELKKIYELGRFIDTSIEPVPENNPSIYRYCQPHIVLNQ